MKAKAPLLSRQQKEDEKFMTMALKLSLLGMGRTEPNPMVGAVVVRDGTILSTGYHREYGQAHAEAMALENLHDAAGATLYLTLEPCAHFGKTPPCSELIIAKKIRRVVAAIGDPNPLVNGRGLKRLRRCGIEITSGVCADWAARINRHYLKAVKARLPYVALRAGVSLDGKLTDKNGHARWITEAESRQLSHSLRGEFSAILAGHNTVVADNPRLTLREPGWDGRTFYRVVLDAQNSLSRRLRIFREQERFPLVIFSSRQAADKTPKVSRHFFVDEDSEGLNLVEVLETLQRMRIASVLVEGGGKVIDSFIRRRLADEVILFVSRRLIGGRASVQLFESGSPSLSQALRLADCEQIELASGHILRGFPACSPA